MNTAPTQRTWRDYLKPHESDALSAMDEAFEKASKERLKIRKRCWRRMLLDRDTEKAK